MREAAGDAAIRRDRSRIGMESGYVYILTNKLHTVLYVGVTTCLSRRMKEHALVCPHLHAAITSIS